MESLIPLDNAKIYKQAKCCGDDCTWDGHHAGGNAAAASNGPSSSTSAPPPSVQGISGPLYGSQQPFSAGQQQGSSSGGGWGDNDDSGAENQSVHSHSHKSKKSKPKPKTTSAPASDASYEDYEAYLQWQKAQKKH